MAIEIRYHVRLDVDEVKTKDSSDLDDKLGNLFFSDEINDIDVFMGNACWSPYIEFWCDTWELAKQYNEAFLAQLKKHRIYAT
jgi:hypothetical protein